MKNLIFLSLLIASLSSCNQSPITIDRLPVVNMSELDSYQRDVQKAFKEIPKEDQETIYKLFAGSAEYLKTAKLTNSANFDPILGVVQTSYNWDRQKYPAFSQSVANLLEDRGYKDPRDLSKESDRLWLAAIFEDLAEATVP